MVVWPPEVDGLGKGTVVDADIDVVTSGMRGCTGAGIGTLRCK